MKILSIIEATTVTGPAKNLLNFCRLVQTPEFNVNGEPVEVSIITFHRGHLEPTVDPNAFVAAAREMGITVDVISERFRFDPHALKQLRAIVAERRPDVIQTHMIKSHFMLKLTGIRKSHPWVAYHHGYTTTDFKMRVYNQLNRWSLPSADRVITVCAAFADQLSRAGVRRERITVRHNSVVPPRTVTADEQRSLKRKFCIAEDERVIVSIGRLSQEKGHADLVEAISILRSIAPDLMFKLLLVGDGPEHEALKRTIAALGIGDYLKFVGHVSDVAPFYAISDAVVLPSHSEGSPNVLLEAMAAGLPVVATSVGGVPEIATSEENALLTAARNPEQLAIALNRVLNDEALAKKLGGKAATRAAEFSPEAHTRALIGIYEEALSAPGALVSEPRAVAMGSVLKSGVVVDQALVSEPGAVAMGSIIQHRAADPVATARGSDTPRVSVIIPLFNKAPYVGRALRSVAEQTFSNLELIVVDDGSTDDGAKVVESFEDRRLRLIKQENAGPGAARNRGLQEAKGELVAFLDADDEWLPNYLAESVSLLDEHRSAAAVVSGYLEHPAGVSRAEMWRRRGLRDGLIQLSPETPPSLAIALLAYMTPCTTVARTHVLREHDGFFARDRCAYGEDAHLWLKVLLNESVAVNLTPLAKIHFEASGAAQTRRSARPVEPFLLDPREVMDSCPPRLNHLLTRVLAIRAFKTACMLGYWGHWREARKLVGRFRVAGHWKLPYYVSSLVCRTPVGAAIGRLSRIGLSL